MGSVKAVRILGSSSQFELVHYVMEEAPVRAASIIGQSGPQARDEIERDDNKRPEASQFFQDTAPPIVRMMPTPMATTGPSKGVPTKDRGVPFFGPAKRMATMPATKSTKPIISVMRNPASGINAAEGTIRPDPILS